MLIAMAITSQFKPHENVAEQLLAVISDVSDDGSHDLSHILRVWRNVLKITNREGGDIGILTAATLLHDCVDVPKDSPERAMASQMAANKATKVLKNMNWKESDIQLVAHAIEAHSFSANAKPLTLEAKILQDADRLDAIGHIGIARCFYVSGRMNRALYNPADPSAKNRALDDQNFAIDHFYEKLLKLAGSFQTETGQMLGARRHEMMVDFLDGFLQEVGRVPDAN